MSEICSVVSVVVGNDGVSRHVSHLRLVPGSRKNVKNIPVSDRKRIALGDEDDGFEETDDAFADSNGDSRATDISVEPPVDVPCVSDISVEHPVDVPCVSVAPEVSNVSRAVVERERKKPVWLKDFVLD